MATDRPYLSASRLNMLARCGLQYAYRYEMGIKVPPGVASVIGTGTHAAVAADLECKRTTGALLPAEYVADEAADAFEAAWEGGPLLSDDEKDVGEKAVKARAKDTAVYLAGVHHEVVAPRITPVAVEREFRLSVEGSDFDLYGYIDIQEPMAVRDTKTTGRAPSESAADESVQLTLYALAVDTIEGSPGKAGRPVVLDYLYRGGEPVYRPKASVRGQGHYAALFNRVRAAARVIQAGAYFPTDPGNWWCSAKWCGYWDRCPQGAKRRVLA